MSATQLVTSYKVEALEPMSPHQIAEYEQLRAYEQRSGKDGARRELGPDRPADPFAQQHAAFEAAARAGFRRAQDQAFGQAFGQARGFQWAGFSNQPNDPKQKRYQASSFGLNFPFNIFVP